ncbi:MAG: tetratricopeptide repeat protein, partial [Bacteroidales bacterium]|nr:tetratricopeptide repeat protein [Bacteroidales bacterium]
ERIEYYLSKDTTDGFFQALLASYEQEFKEYGDDFVKRILSVIALSKDGLSEDAIVSICKTTPLYWSRLYCALDSSLCSKLGRISFKHSYVRDSVEKRYRLDKRGENLRFDILEYSIPLMEESDRDAFLEVPYQLYKINSEDTVEALYNFIQNPVDTATLYDNDEGLCREYWLYLKRNGYSFNSFLERKEDVFKGNHLDQSQRMLSDLSSLLHSFGEFITAMELRKAFLTYLESQQDTPVDVYVKTLNDVANEWDKSPEHFHDAFNYYSKAMELAKQHSLPELSVAYNGMARLCIKAKMNDIAVNLATMALKLNVDRYGDIHPEVAVNYNNLADAYTGIGENEKSIECYRKAINIIETLNGSKAETLIIAYHNLAVALSECTRYADALESIENSIRIIRGIYGDDYFDLESYLTLKKDIESNIKNS